MTPAKRSIILFGTEQPIAQVRLFHAGALSVELEQGSLRYIRWGGFEVLRAIAFIVRDSGWGTYAPEIRGLEVEETQDRFLVRYTATCDGTEGDLRYEAQIEGRSDGRLIFSAHGKSDRGFTTNRTGFVILHPLAGVVGQAAEIEHASGGTSKLRFPELVDPKQPALDIRAIRYMAAPSLTIDVRTEGDVYEMEDHRNWTDASFKTYVRPLSRGYPYKIAAGKDLDQRVTVALSGRAPAPASAATVIEVSIGEPTATMPDIGLFAAETDVTAALGVAPALARVKPSYLVVRVDGRTSPDIAGAASLAERMGIPISLDLIIAGQDPETELRSISTAVAAVGMRPVEVFPVPQRDFRARAHNYTPAGEATPEAILAGARRAFPGVPIGGGVPVGFAELNRNRPAPGIDFITHATQATVHAADDRSVMETLEALPAVICSARAIVGPIRYRLGLASIGAPASTYYATPAQNQSEERVAQAESDPRRRGLFGAAFALGYASVASASGVEALTLGAAAGPAGILAGVGEPLPVAMVIEGLSALAGRPRFTTRVGSGAVAALAAKGETGKVLWLANLSAEPRDLRLERQRFTSIWRMDAAALAVANPAAIASGPFTGDTLALDAYSVCRLS